MNSVQILSNLELDEWRHFPYSMLRMGPVRPSFPSAENTKS
jgi:hypothetical protein